MGVPLIPYIKIPEIPLPFPKPIDSIKPFGVLVATGVYLGAIVAIRRARQRGINVEKMNTFIFYVVGFGFIFAHIIDAIFYTPEKVAESPLYLLNIPAGLSSYGGFIGAIIGLYLYKWKFKESVIGYADTVCSAFPLAWVFGRAGCASVHDHPGRITDLWMGVQYFHPDVRNSDKYGFLFDPGQTQGRFDLGLIEMVLTIPLALAFHFLWRAKPRAFGFYAGWMSIYYAIIRFPLDFLRIAPGDPTFRGEGDPRHLGLTPAQFACFGLLALGIILVRNTRLYPAPASWSEVKPYDPDAEANEEEEPKAEPKKKDRGQTSAMRGEERTAARKKRRRQAKAEAEAREQSAAKKPEESAEETARKAPAKPDARPDAEAAAKDEPEEAPEGEEGKADPLPASEGEAAEVSGASKPPPPDAPADASKEAKPRES